MIKSHKIWITFQFEGFHCWPAAPEKVAFLRSLHRHLFHVKVTWLVSHDDRDREFFIEKDRALTKLDEIARAYGDAVKSWSCERWAEELLILLGACEVEVSEDGENGAIVTAG